MSKLLVYKASAGSGKTYRLASEYIKLLIVSPENYKKILAVTFTNKATAEMKGRIIDELFNISQGKKSSMSSEICEELDITHEVLQQKAEKALSYILHDYSSFSVSTIDSFVQRVIQALLWEIGEQGGAEIQLDTEPILELAADNLLDSASQYKELMQWLSIMGENLMEEGGSWDVRKRLISLGKQIFSENFRLLKSEDIEKLTDRKKVEELKIELHRLVNGNVSTVNRIAGEILTAIVKAGIDEDLFKGKQRGFIGFVNKCKKMSASEDELPDACAKVVQDVLADSTGEAWVSKEIAKNISVFNQIKNLVQGILFSRMFELVEYIDNNRLQYVSAKLILRNLENLALIGDLWHKIRELSVQENFLVLSDSGHLLHEFVKDSDAPFVYEKIGNRYDSFMIDEFQDTSVVQWHNFKPLIENSLSQDSFSMLVGDVKQSIYRWRNGDWRILAQDVNNEFAHHGIDIKPLRINWRSLPAVIHFNNSFFSNALIFLKNFIKEQTEGLNPSLSESMVNQIQSAYNDLNQIPREGLVQNSGYVEVRFFESESNNDYTEKLADYLPQLILKIRERHKPGDIAILVRSKSEGQKVANILIDHNRKVSAPGERIHFMSQEGLFLKSSSVVRFMISAFKLVQNPDDYINRRILSKELQTLRKTDECDWHKIFSDDYLEEEVRWLSQLNTMNLQESFDSIIARFRLSEQLGEMAYLAELHEQVLAFSARGGADISRFVDWWDENSESLSLSVPESSNAVSILTIHKSKGLEFPTVILPYVNWPFRVSTKPPLIWVSNSEMPFSILPMYPIYSTQLANNSLFAHEAQEEKLMELVDNLNLLYVAFTRSKNELYIFSPDSKSGNNKEKINSVDKLINEVLPSLKQDLSFSKDISFCTDNNYFSFGNTSNSATKHNLPETPIGSWKIESYNVADRKKSNIKLKQEAKDFFNSFPSQDRSAIEHGKVMHLLFSMIKDINQIEKAILNMVTEGLIGSYECQGLSVKIKELLRVEPFRNWFSGEWDVKSEATILTVNGHSYRPDRVMFKENSTIIIDFKFGTEQPHYKKQVKQYAHLLKEMGYKNIEGYLWYVDDNNLYKVDL